MKPPACAGKSGGTARQLRREPRDFEQQDEEQEMRRTERQDDLSSEPTVATPVGRVTGGDGANTADRTRTRAVAAKSVTQSTSQPALLTVAEVATQLRCSKANVYALVAQGRLRCYRIGAGNGGIRFAETHLEEFLLAAEDSRLTFEIDLTHLR